VVEHASFDLHPDPGTHDGHAGQQDDQIGQQKLAGKRHFAQRGTARREVRRRRQQDPGRNERGLFPLHATAAFWSIPPGGPKRPEGSQASDQGLNHVRGRPRGCTEEAKRLC
jgi:hypothetical protein